MADKKLSVIVNTSCKGDTHVFTKDLVSHLGLTVEVISPQPTAYIHSTHPEARTTDETAELGLEKGTTPSLVQVLQNPDGAASDLP